MSAANFRDFAAAPNPLAILIRHYILLAKPCATGLRTLGFSRLYMNWLILILRKFFEDQLNKRKRPWDNCKSFLPVKSVFFQLGNMEKMRGCGMYVFVRKHCIFHHQSWNPSRVLWNVYCVLFIWTLTLERLIMAKNRIKGKKEWLCNRKKGGQPVMFIMLKTMVFWQSTEPYLNFVFTVPGLPNSTSSQ